MYERFYGFADRPFRLTPDPAYLFLSDKHREAYAHLDYALEDGSGFAVITGAIGTGKTTLVRSLIARADPEVAVAYIFNPVLTVTELLQTVNCEFGLPSRTRNKKELTESLNVFLSGHKADGGRAVVIIDEAQNLEPAQLEQLRMLSNFETEKEKLLQIILLGQPELRALLDMPELAQLAQRVSVRWHLEPLDRKETGDYVCHRLSVAGGQPTAGGFSDSALDLIFRHSRGVPRLINMLCHRSLLVGYTKGVRSVGAAEVAIAALELGRSRASLPTPARGWAAPAMTALGVAAAAAAMAFLLLLPLDESGGAAESILDYINTGRAAAAPKRHSGGEAASVEAVRKTLVKMTPYDSGVQAVSELLASWGTDPLDDGRGEGGASGGVDLESIAAGRGLRYVALSTGLPLVEIMDLPLIIEVKDGGDPPRYLFVERLTEERVVVRLERKNVVFRRADLGDLWNGNVHLLWRDARRLAASLAPGNKGPAVSRLQSLMRELGLFSARVSGVYDDATEDAIGFYQTSKGMTPNGIAGHVTQLLLSNDLPGNRRPALGSRSAAGEQGG